MSERVGESQDEVRESVRERYAAIARESASCCAPTTQVGGCCGGPAPDPRRTSQSIGYDGEALDSVPAEANLGLGCGTPTALAALKADSTPCSPRRRWAKRAA